MVVVVVNYPATGKMPVQVVKREVQSDPVGRIAAGDQVVALPRLLTQSRPSVWYERHGAMVVSEPRHTRLGAKRVVRGRMPDYTGPWTIKDQVEGVCESEHVRAATARERSD